MNYLSCILAGLAALALAALTGCATEAGNATPGFWAPAHPGASSARYGVLLEFPPGNETANSPTPHPAK